jgi:hypothetical protein
MIATAKQHSSPGAATPGGEPLDGLTRPECEARVAAWLGHLLEPAQVTELRALKVRRRGERQHTVSGFFDYDHLEDMAAAALEVSPHARGVYFVLNPLKPDILARRCNRTDWAEEGELAADRDVARRRWLLIDADPVRDSGVSATAAEKGEALRVIRAVRDHLRGRGWPAPVLADSGNGYHLLYRLDLPADDGGLVKRILHALAARFDTPAVKVDQTVFNPARVCKLPGTWARKGDSTPDRPHRRSCLLEVPR